MFKLILSTFSVLIFVSNGAFIPTGPITPISDGRIVGGYDIAIEEIPYQVSLRYMGSHICGGSIVTENIIITAAHCVHYVVSANFIRFLKIRVGSDKRSEGGMIMSIKTIKVHDKFVRETDGNDVALIWLDTDLTFSNSIQPIPLAKKNANVSEGFGGLVSGWGKLVETSKYFPENLQATKVQIIDISYCNMLYSSLIKPTMICAGIKDIGGQDACQADSGGPFVINDELTGIVSWGIGCAQQSYPGVYASVPELRDWIDENMELDVDQ